MEVSDLGSDEALRDGLSLGVESPAVGVQKWWHSEQNDWFRIRL